MSPCRLVLPALAALCASCTPQAGADYLGEPLVTLHGQVASTGVLPPLEAAMLWQRGAPPSTDDIDLATRAPVESGFPSTFTLHVYQPPPGVALRTLAPGEPAYARANAAAVPEGIAAAALGSIAAAGTGAPGAGTPGTGGVCVGCSYGLDADHWLVYLPADVPVFSITEWWLGGALPAGFHLLRVTAVDPACIKPADLNACALDLAQRGAPDDGSKNPGTARWYCAQPYKLAPAPDGEELLLQLGALGLGPAAGCP